MAQRRASMADVAALAGVSGQTVSRVVNDSPKVHPATRRRVEEVMAQLGYRPHRAARALRTGRTDTIGVIVSTLATVGNSRMLQAIADAASLRGYALTIVTATGPDAVARGFSRLHAQGVDGAIILNEATAQARSVEASEGLALVVVDSPLDERYVVVQTDHAAGARAATSHLLGRGHATVWHLGGPEDSFAAAERERGWRETLVEAGVPVPPVARGDWTAGSGYAASRELRDATAIFAGNDQMALGLLRGLSGLGRRVPDDVAIVGFDDVEDSAEYRPPLTTVRQDFDALGEAAVSALVRAIDGAPVESTVMTPRLVGRESA